MVHLTETTGGRTEWRPTADGEFRWSDRDTSAYLCSKLEEMVTGFILCRSPEDTASGLNAGTVYGVEQTEDALSTSNTEASGKKLEKDLKPRSMKGDMPEPLSQYDINSYPSKSQNKAKRIWIFIH